MFHDFILHYAKLAIAVIFFSFIVVKLLVIRAYGLRLEWGRLFMMSLRILGRPVIENTYFDRLKEYYRVSNKINLVFYVAGVFFFTLYLLVKLYMT